MRNSTEDYLYFLHDLATNNLLPISDITMLRGYVNSIYRSELQNKYSEPMLWIGLYIAAASLLCVLAMTADLLHGLRNRRFWIPCKYFSINATSLLLISVAMKLPVDLSGAMLGGVDQSSKLGSMAFMCTMMANLLPSLAGMDSNELLTNITALGVLVVTLVVNVCIQLKTGVVIVKDITDETPGPLEENVDIPGVISVGIRVYNVIFAATYVTILIVLLIIHVCSSLAILKSKQIIESKYQLRHETASKESPRRLLSVEKLQQHVRNYWIMAGSGSPQFIAACSVTTTAAGVISVVPAILHTITMSWTIKAMIKKETGYDSDYKWSMVVILIVQFIGVIVGTIAPFSRCFATLSFKMSIKSILNHIKVFKVESYWSAKLSEWKHGSMPFLIRSPNIKAFIHDSRDLILKFCIMIQKTVVVLCKLIAVIPFFFMICVWYCFHCTLSFRSGQKFEILEQNRDLTRYVLQLEDEIELAERTLEGFLKTMNHLIQKGEKKQPKGLESLIVNNSTSHFQEVFKFEDHDHIPSLLSKENQDCWSLSVVTLTTIAVSLPNVGKEQVDILLKSVGEGLDYVTLVEETLNATDDYAIVRKAAGTLWPQVNFHRKWLGNELQKLASSTSGQVDKTRQVIEWFKDTAEKKGSSAVGGTDTRGLNDDSTLEFICANSMHRITQTILHSHQTSINDKVSEKQLFDKLSTMIADIIGVCLTNLPQVIVMKCQTSPIEKRETNVQAAAQLLGETKQIIMIVQDRQGLLDIETNG